MLIPFDSTSTERAYNNHHEQPTQIGGMHIPIYAGSKTQRGHGLGAIFGSLLKSALPMIKQGAMSLGKTALKTGLGVAHDALTKKNLKEAFRDNTQRAGSKLLQKAIKSYNKPNKKKRQLTSNPTSRRTSRGKRRKIQRSRDIFS